MQRKRKKLLTATMGESSAVRNRRIKSLDKEDLISELPDSIIQHILSFLPSTREAVRTGILSKRWRDQWTRVPVLIFTPLTDSHGCPLASSDECDYLRFIETSLILHDCPKITKFHLEYDSPNHCLDPQFSSKVRFAIRKCVEELVLVSEIDDAEDSYLLPKVLLDCASLVRLEMVDFALELNWRVNWPSLKSLKLKGVYYDKNRSKGIENVLSGCPLLEWLELQLCVLENVAIVSESLKVLCFVNVDIPTTIRISCPNLVELNVVDGHYDSSFPEQMIESVLSSSPFIQSLNLWFCNGPDKVVIASKSLEVLSIALFQTTMIEVSCPNLEKLDFHRQNGEIFRARNLPSSVCATICDAHPQDQNSVKEMLEQFQHVNDLTLGSSLFMCLSELYMDGCVALPVLNSRCLTVNVYACFGLAIPGIAYALRSPRLESLVIKLELGSLLQDTLDKELQDYWKSNGCADFTCLAADLKTVKIIDSLYGRNGKFKPILEFIEFLLENARVLEKMILVVEKPGKGFMSKISKKLSSMRRHSRCVSVELCSS